MSSYRISHDLDSDKLRMSDSNGVVHSVEFSGSISGMLLDKNEFHVFQPQIPQAPECTSAKTVAFTLLDDCLNTDWNGVAYGTVADENTYVLTGENAFKFTCNGLAPGGSTLINVYRTYGAGSYLNIQPYDFIKIRYYLPELKTDGSSNLGDLVSLSLRIYDVNNYYRTYMIFVNHTAQFSGWHTYCGTKLGYDSESNAAFDETQIKEVHIFLNPSSCIAFTGGTTEPTLVSTVTGNTSAAYMVITQVVVVSGSFAGGDAAGYFYGLVGGTFTKGETFKITDNSDSSVISANAGMLPYTQLSFTSGGTYEMKVGDTVTGATSGATGVIVAILNRGGTYAGGDASGHIFFETTTGTFQAENVNVGSNSNVATVGSGNALVAKALAGAKNELVVDSIQYDSGYDCPGVILRIDDGYTESYAVASYLASLGLRASFMIVPSHVGTTGFLTWDQIRAIHRMGHDIASHGYEHELMDRISASRAKFEAMRTRNALFEEGLPDTSQVYCPPQGRWSTIAEDTLSPYVPLMYMCYTDSSRVQGLDTRQNPSRIPGISVSDTTGLLSSSAYIGKNSVTTKSVENACRDAIAQRAFICLYWHQPTGAGLTQFKADMLVIKKYIDGGSLKNYSATDILYGRYDRTKLGRLDDADGKTVAAWENEYINYMNGAGTWVLPEASTVLGKTFWFIKTTADDTYIDVDAGDTISYAGCAAGDRLLGTGAAGDQVRLTAVDDNTWIVSSVIGTWTDGN